MNCPTLRTRALTASLLFVWTAFSFAPVAMELRKPEIRFLPAEGLGLEQGICRRDPSDVIHVANKYYVWYTKLAKAPGVYLYPSGYSGSIWYATSLDGHSWKEQGECLPKGKADAWDGHGALTPEIVEAKGKYYLFYSGVRNPMTAETPTAIGLAASDSPDGPWKKYGNQPVLAPEKDDPSRFDSFKVDDACVIVRGGKYWLYFKGRQLGHTSRETKWGVAMAGQPTGPWVRSTANPVTNSGHEVLIWPHRTGVAALLGPIGPEGNTIQYAEDGIHFRVMSKITDPPRAPGGFRPDAYTGKKFGGGMPWGIATKLGPDPYLVRFETNFGIEK